MTPYSNMAGLADFLETYWPSILTVVVTFLTLLTVFKMTGVNFTPVEDKHVDKVVTIEGFESTPDSEAVVAANDGDKLALHGICTGLSSKACKNASYCVLLSGDRCVGGTKRGPTYLTKDGNKVDYEYYHHKGECKGACPE